MPFGDDEKKPATGSTPVVSGTPKPEARTSREATIHEMSPSQLDVAFRHGEVSEEELVRIFGPNIMGVLGVQVLTASEQKALAGSAPIFNIPAAPAPAAAPAAPEAPSLVKNVPFLRNAAGMNAQDVAPHISPPSFGQDSAAGSAGLVTGDRPAAQGGGTKTGTSRSSGSGSGGSGGGIGGSGGYDPKLDSGLTGGPVFHNDPLPYVTYQGQRYALPRGADIDSKETQDLLLRLKMGNTEGSIVGNSATDFAYRGGIGLPNNGGTILLNGQQYRNNNTQEQGGDGLWYNVGPDGQPMGAGFKSQSAAKLASEYSSAGPGLTSKSGVSPTARAAGQGGFTNTIPTDPNAPGHALFNTIGLDQSIAAGATKGNQAGEILGTSIRQGYPNLDITLGGISAGGGMTPVTDAQGQYQSFTGQLANNTSIGQSSPTTGTLNDILHTFQMQGIPESATYKILQSQGQAGLIQLQQRIDDLRSQGLMPDLSSLASQWEPAMSGQELQIGNSRGNPSNTPYDKALGIVLGGVGGDLSYLPNPSQGGNAPQYDEFGFPQTYANGGSFMTPGPMYMVDARTGERKALLGEAGPEKVTIQPTDVTMGREMKGGIQPFASGGEIYTGGKNPYQPQYDTANPALGYNDSQFTQTPGGSGTSLWQVGGTQGGYGIATPRDSLTGQPAPARFQDMSPQQLAKFTNNTASMDTQYTGQVTTAPVSYQLWNGQYLPVYDTVGGNDYSGLPEGYITNQPKPTNIAGQPGLVNMPTYSGPPIASQAQQDANSVRYLTALLNGQDTGMLSPGSLGYGITGADRSAQLAALYDLDPKAAMLIASQGPPQDPNGHGQWGGPRQDRNIENEAARKRQYEINGRNYARAGLPSPTILDIPRQTWNGTGTPPWGSGEAPYQRYGREVQNGYTLPFDYEVNSPWYNRGNVGMGGGWGRGYGGGQHGQPGLPPRGGTGGNGYPSDGNQQGNQGNQQGNQWGGQHGSDGPMHALPMPQRGGGQNSPWFNQLPWWARNARQYGPPVGSGMMGAA